MLKNEEIRTLPFQILPMFIRTETIGLVIDKDGPKYSQTELPQISAAKGK